MRFPIDYLRRRGHITSPPSDHAGVMRELLGFFNVADIDSLLAYAPQPLAAYRQAQAFEADDYAVATWIQCGVHDPAALRAALPKLRDLTLAEDFGQAIVDIAADAGVVVIVDPAPPRTRCWGVTRWVGDTPVVQLTGRGKKNDHFWFTLFHELGHVLLHSPHRVFVDGQSDTGEVDAAESQADEFARDILISPQEWARRPMTRNLDEIRNYAAALGIHPGIVVGRIQHESGKYSWGNSLKQTMRIVQ